MYGPDDRVKLFATLDDAKAYYRRFEEHYMTQDEIDLALVTGFPSIQHRDIDQHEFLYLRGRTHIGYTVRIALLPGHYALAEFFASEHHDNRSTSDPH